MLPLLPLAAAAAYQQQRARLPPPQKCQPIRQALRAPHQPLCVHVASLLRHQVCYPALSPVSEKPVSETARSPVSKCLTNQAHDCDSCGASSSRPGCLTAHGHLRYTEDDIRCDKPGECLCHISLSLTSKVRLGTGSSGTPSLCSAASAALMASTQAARSSGVGAASAYLS